MEQLREYSWPGNIRELQSIVKQALLHASGTVLIPSFLPEMRTDGKAPPNDSIGPQRDWKIGEFIQQRLKDGTTNLHGEAIAEFDRILLPAVLRFTDGSQHQAAKVLGIARQTLRLRLRELGIAIARTIVDGDDRVD